MPGYLPRLFTVPGDSLDSEGASEAKLTRRTLTNLYNDRSTWLQHGHADLLQAVWAAYGWDDPYPAVVDGEGALSLIAHEPPDLVISDVMMPRRDGLAVLLTLRRAGVLIPASWRPTRPQCPGGLPPAAAAPPAAPSVRQRTIVAAATVVLSTTRAAEQEPQDGHHNLGRR